MEPEKILTRKVFAEPHRVYVGPRDREEDQVNALITALKDMMRKELVESVKTGEN